GANASGKSNFIHILEFIRDIEMHGLENAVSLQGGSEYLRNIKIGHNHNLSIEITLEVTGFGILPIDGAGYNLRIEAPEVMYKFALGFPNNKPGFEIIEEELSGTINIIKVEDRKEEPLISKFRIKSHKGKLETAFDTPKELHKDKEKIENTIFPFNEFFKHIPGKVSSMPESVETSLLKFPMFLRIQFSELGVYNFNPRLLRESMPISGKADLEEDGSNLPIVLKNIIDNTEKKRKFLNLVSDVLPFVEDLEVERLADRSMLLRLREAYSQKNFLPASCLSDGTLNLTALIISLYFERKEPVIIEEPERNIHPHLISRTLQMMKEAAVEKQVIVTTHNPELLKHADIEDLLFISRDRDGFSRIARPAHSRDIQTFIENEMSIDELYVQNLMEIPGGK
ncbi:MAG: ATP-binding protein, partial [Candidatus Aminicenantes bacterium]|nr:ATP-binding protein [Candidatus Aminicenantes bacterium]